MGWRGDRLVESLQIFSTYAMFGLIWMVQLVHYPSFYRIEKSTFRDFQEFHSRKITLIVFPLMLIELLTGLYLVYIYKNLFWSIQLGLVLFIWLATMLISVPIHNKLKSYDRENIKALIQTNWFRTIAWSLKSLILINLKMGLI